MVGSEMVGKIVMVGRRESVVARNASELVIIRRRVENLFETFVLLLFCNATVCGVASSSFDGSSVITTEDCLDVTVLICTTAIHNIGEA